MLWFERYSINGILFFVALASALGGDIPIPDGKDKGKKPYIALYSMRIFMPLPQTVGDKRHYVGWLSDCCPVSFRPVHLCMMQYLHT